MQTKTCYKRNKKKTDKETVAKWSDQACTINGVTHEQGGDFYGLEGVDGYLKRHELLKV